MSKKKKVEPLTGEELLQKVKELENSVEKKKLKPVVTRPKQKMG